MHQKVLLLVFVAFVSVYAQYRFDCDEKFCLKKDKTCSKLNCKDGRIVKHATQCGCCDICIKSLGEGEKCQTTVHGIGDIQECGDGLICDTYSKLCVPANTKCIKEREAFDREKGSTLVTPKPECDHFGHYKPVVCIPGVICYCVDKDGERIFGSDLTTNNETMKCDCSRDIKYFPRKVDSGGNFPRCLPNGNYDPLQCSDEMCFCMESLDEADIVNINSSLNRLSCFDKKIHGDRLISKCWRERDDQLTMLKKNESFSAIIGVDLTECDLDRSYFPVQCEKDRCYCVNKNGERYDGFDIERTSSPHTIKMICDCFRDKDLVRTINEDTENLHKFEKMNCRDLKA